MKSSEIYQRRGWWWRTMGFTKTHILGVFITETVVGLIGTAVFFFALMRRPEDVVAWLLIAVCIFLLQLGVLLSSILSLLFYIGSRIERATNEKVEDDDVVA